MGVKCSLLGHDYGDSDVERERDEEGNEVVRTAKRVERCRSCGHTRTISANTEVTTLESAAGVVREPDGTVVATNSATMAEESGGSVVIETDDDRLADDRPTDNRPADTPEIAERATAPDSDGDETEPDREDDPISPIDRIERESDSPRPGRAPGEWPTDSDTITDGRGSSVADTGATGRWPAESDTGITVEENSEQETASGKRRTRQPGDTLSCGSCGFASPIADSPLRAGDICPDCGTGYLAWETRKG